MALGPVSFSGVASGFDIKGIITAILNAEHLPVDRLQTKQSGLDARKAAYNDLSSKLTALRTALQDLTSQSTVSSRTATSSDTSVFTASAATGADLGAHEIEVQTLARSHKVRSISVANRFDPAVADGTITIQSGSRSPITVNVSAAAGNNSLVGVRDAINSANQGVTASVVNDGSGDLLVVRSTNTGTANALTVTDTTNLDLDTAPHVLETAANATAVVDGVTVSSASNTLTTAIAGVTVTLVSAKIGTKLALTVGADTGKVTNSVKSFVDAYNAVASLLKSQFSADPKTGKAGVLAGDALLRRVQDTLASSVSSGVSGIPSTDLTTLGAIGISIEGSSGQLKIDDAKLSSALSDHFDQVGRLFAAAGRATDTAVGFVGLTSATTPGTYDVGVTTAPERATILGSAAIVPNGISFDETLTITEGSSTANVSLASGDTLDRIVTKLNLGLASAGLGVRASADEGKLRLSSTDYGSAVSFSVVSDVQDEQGGKTTGFGDVTQTDAGVDIAGTLNGVAATGVGTVLTGADGTAVEGLQVSVTTDAATVAAKNGQFGSITVTRGVADLLARSLKTIVDPTGGLISTAVAGFDEERRRIGDEISTLEARLKEREVFLTFQFDAAERAISALQQQQSALGRSFSLV